ncbi:MAG: hypothetical protein ACFCVG_01650 [Kineosporiaceae bacterium]
MAVVVATVLGLVLVAAWREAAERVALWSLPAGESLLQKRIEGSVETGGVVFEDIEVHEDSVGDFEVYADVSWTGTGIVAVTAQALVTADGDVVASADPFVRRDVVLAAGDRRRASFHTKTDHVDGYDDVTFRVSVAPVVGKDFPGRWRVGSLEVYDVIVYEAPDEHPDEDLSVALSYRVLDTEGAGVVVDDGAGQEGLVDLGECGECVGDGELNAQQEQSGGRRGQGEDAGHRGVQVQVMVVVLPPREHPGGGHRTHQQRRELAPPGPPPHSRHRDHPHRDQRGQRRRRDGGGPSDGDVEALEEARRREGADERRQHGCRRGAWSDTSTRTAVRSCRRHSASGTTSP